MRNRKGRKQLGVSLVEFCASLVFGLPLVVSVLYAVLEANFLFTIRTNLDMAVRRYAQTAIQAYETNGNSTSNAESTALAAVSIPHFVDPTLSQFTVDWNNTGSTHPYTITVTCKYPSGGAPSKGLPPFPDPDPFHLGSSFRISATGTFALNPE